MIVAVTGAFVVLVAVKAGIVPVPEAAKPIDVVLLVQDNTAPVTSEVSGIAVTATPLQ